MLVRKLLRWWWWWWWIVPWMRERDEARLIEDDQRTCFDMTSRSGSPHLTRCHQGLQKLCTSTDLYLSRETMFRIVMLVSKTALLMMRDSCVSEKNEACFFEDVQRGALMWHKDQKRHTWAASPGLPLMMASKSETPFKRLVRKLCFDCHVSHKTDVLMIMDSWEMKFAVIEDAYRWWHQEEKFCTSKTSSLVRKLYRSVMLGRKLLLRCKQQLRGRELNPGLPRDRRKYWPLYYRRSDQ